MTQSLPRKHHVIGRAAALAVFGLFAAASGEAKIIANGISLNGISPNGISPNGISLNGVSLNGVSYQGTNVHGAAATATTAVERGTVAQTPDLGSLKLTGATLLRPTNAAR